MIYNHFISKFATIIFMDQISFIRKPVEKELEAFNVVFDKCFVHDNNLINKILQFIHQKKGKQMRPILVLLTAKLNGEINDKTLYSAVTLELLHTASLVHDDVVDESESGRGTVRAAGKRWIRPDGRSPLSGAFDTLRYGSGAGTDTSWTAGAAHRRAAPKAASLGQG